MSARTQADGKAFAELVQLLVAAGAEIRAQDYRGVATNNVFVFNWPWTLRLRMHVRLRRRLQRVLATLPERSAHPADPRRPTLRPNGGEWELWGRPQDAAPLVAALTAGGVR